MNPRDFLVVAESLARGSLTAPHEAQYRTAIGRAYYALLITLRDGIQSSSGTIRYSSGPQVHGEIRNDLTFSAHSDDVQDIAQFLDQLKSDRNDSDYKPNKPVSKDKAEAAVEDARKMLQLFADIMKDADSRQKFLEAILAYREVIRKASQS